MNDLFSGSFSRFKNNNNSNEDEEQNQRGSGGGGGGVGSSVQMSAMGANLDKFFEDVEGIKDELKEIETIHSRLQSSHEETKTLHNAQSIKTLRSRMDADIALALKKAKLIKVRLEALDRANAATRTVPGCGPGSSSDRTRTSLVAGLRKKLKDSMEGFNRLRDQIQREHRETVRRRIFAVTGEEAEDGAVEAMIAAGESEGILRRAVEEGRGGVVEVVREARERFDAVKEMERSLEELRQVFLDMAVVVEAQGEQLDDIESQVGRASSFVRSGAQQLETARKHQKNTRKWTCIAVIVLLVIVLVTVLPIVLRNRSSGGGGGGNTNSAGPPPPPPPPPPGGR